MPISFQDFLALTLRDRLLLVQEVVSLIERLNDEVEQAAKPKHVSSVRV